MKTFFIFYKFFRKYKRALFASLLFSLLASVLNGAPPFLYRYLVNNFQTLTLKTLFVVIGLFFAVKIGTIISNNLFFYIGDMAVASAARDARIKVFSKLQELDFAFHVNKKSGEFISKIKRGDSSFFSVHYALNGEFLGELFNFLVVAATFSFINIKIFFALIIFLVLNIIVSIYFLKKNMKARINFNNEEDNISHLIVDNLINYETVKYFAKEKREINNLTRDFKKWKKAFWDFGITFRKMNIAIGALSTTTIITILYISGTAVINKNLTSGDFVLITIFIMQFFPGFQGLIRRMREVVKSHSDLKDYFDILDYPLVMRESENPVKIKNVVGTVNFKNVSFAYPSGQEVLKNINLEIIPESTTALVGRSGSGKTTFTKLLLRIYDPIIGEVEIDGHDLKDLKKEDLRRMIGVVPQEPILFNNTIAYNISYPKDDVGEKEIEAAARLANLHDFIVLLPRGYDTIVGERGVKLSGGEKQRLAIARVFLLNPPIIIFDEATSHLDSESERLIQDSIEKLREHKTLIIIAHRLSTIMKADKIIVLNQGAIKETGIHSELISKKRGIYKLLWNLQTEGAVI